MNLYKFTVPKNGEDFTTLLEHKNIKIIRIVSSDQIEPIEYIQDEDEWVVIIEGEAILFVLKIKDGTIWLAIHIF
jgi:cupin 2 domain-containing protein